MISSDTRSGATLAFELLNEKLHKSIYIFLILELKNSSVIIYDTTSFFLFASTDYDYSMYGIWLPVLNHDL